LLLISRCLANIITFKAGDVRATHDSRLHDHFYKNLSAAVGIEPALNGGVQSDGRHIKDALTTMTLRMPVCSQPPAKSVMLATYAGNIWLRKKPKPQGAEL
jgi:hypothetical protein